MKTKLRLTVLLSLNFCLLSSQVPQGFNYQAIARGSDGKDLVNTSLQVMVSILSDTAGFYASNTGTYIWEEQQSVTTNSLGLINIVIGNPTATRIGGTAASFSAIDWTLVPLYIGIKINYSGSWKTMGSAKLWTVPYSMVSGNLAGPLKKLAVTGTTSVMDEPLFEVKNKNGQTVFAVYNEGVRVYVDDGITKGTKGGFAIGGFGADKAASKSYFIVNADSIRAYIAPNTGKGSKGGFAIGGFDATKTVKGEEYLRVTRDSTRIYVDNGAAKGTKGGFAIGGFDATKGTSDNFMQLTPENYFIGHNSGKNITTGLYNSFLGYMSGYKNSTGSSNTFFGDSTGLNNTTGSWNVFMGKEAGYSNIASVSNVYIGNGAGKMAVHTSKSTASYNVAIGTLAGYYNNGKANCFVGQEAGFSNEGGRYNVFLGIHSGQLNDTANFNVFLGSNTGYNNMGNANVFIGNYAGYSNLGASYNVFVGNNAGTSTTSGEKNVILGSDAGYYNTTGTYNTFVGNLTGNLNTTGSYNIYLGNIAGTSATGNYNTAIGNAAGKAITSDYNTMIGFQTGYSTTTGSGNAFFGHQAGHENISGTHNTYIGPSAGYYNTSGSYNVMIGSEAGAYEYGSNKLVIDNSVTSTPLIGGDFFYNRVGINRMPTTYALEVGGTIWANGSTIVAGSTIWSDARYKTDITPLTGSLSDILKMQGIKYNWKQTEFPELNFPQGEQIGLIAQDLEKILPELVYTGPDGYKSISYEKLTPVLIEAIKEQQKQLETQQKELDELKTLVSTFIANQTGQGNK